MGIATALELIGIAMAAVALGVALSWPWGMLAVGLGTTAFGVLLDARAELRKRVEQ